MECLCDALVDWPEVDEDQPMPTCGPWCRNQLFVTAAKHFAAEHRGASWDKRGYYDPWIASWDN